jgi:hypothetical protein
MPDWALPDDWETIYPEMFGIDNYEPPSKDGDEFKAKAEALLDKYSGQIAEDKKYSAWVDACVADGYWKDLYHNMKQRFGK